MIMFELCSQTGTDGVGLVVLCHQDLRQRLKSTVQRQPSKAVSNNIYIYIIIYIYMFDYIFGAGMLDMRSTVKANIKKNNIYIYYTVSLQVSHPIMVS